MLRNYFSMAYYFLPCKNTCVWLFLRYIFWWQPLFFDNTAWYIMQHKHSVTSNLIKNQSFKYRTLWGNVTLENECKRMKLNMSIILNARKTLIYIEIGVSLSCSMSPRFCTKIVKVIAPFLFKKLTELCWPDCFPWHQNMWTSTLSLKMAYPSEFTKEHFWWCTRRKRIWEHFWFHNLNWPSWFF